MTDEETTEPEDVQITPLKSKSTVYCERCKPREVEAEWNFKAPGEKVEHMCDTHARWNAAESGLLTFPGDG